MPKETKKLRIVATSTAYCADLTVCEKKAEKTLKRILSCFNAAKENYKYRHDKLTVNIQPQA